MSVNEGDEEYEYKDGAKDTIEVRGPEHIINRYKLDLLQLYFESQRGINGSVTDISFDAANDVVVIKFDSDQVAQRIIECPSYVLKGESLNVKLRKNPKIHGSSAQTTHAASKVRVSGLKRIEAKEIIEYYFENRRRSGGGPITSFVPVESDGDIYEITFENTKDAQSVIERRHIINGLSVDVALLHKDRETEYYHDRFLIKGLPNNTSDEYLLCFIKAATGMKPKFLAFHKKEKDVVLVIMRCDLEIAQLIEHCKEETLEGAKIQISEVELSNVIHVSNLPENIHSDTIVLYFENKRKSKGGIVKNVIRLDTASCLVYFKDYKVIEGVLGHVHVLQRRDLTVRKYFKCVAQTEDEAFSTNIPQAVVIPDLDIRILKFIQQNKIFKQIVEQELLSHHAQVVWPKEGSDSCEVSINCIVDTSNVLSNRVILRWGEEIREVFKFLMDKIYVHCITLIGEFNFDDSCVECTAGNDENILVLLDRGECTITFVGTSPKLVSTLRSQDNFSEDAEEELKVEKVLLSHAVEFQMLRSLGYREKIATEMPNICIKESKDDSAVELEGYLLDIRKAKLIMLDIRNEIKTVYFYPLSAISSNLYSKSPTVDFVNKCLQYDGLDCIWSVSHNTLIICCHKKYDPKMCMDVMKAAVIDDVIHLTIEVDRRDMRRLEKKTNEIESTFSGKVAISLTGNGEIHFCSTKDIREVILNKLRAIIQRQKEMNECRSKEDTEGKAQGPNRENRKPSEPEMPKENQTKIIVSNLPLTTQNEYLQMFFENKRTFKGCDVYNVEMYEDGTSAIIEFETPEATDIVMSKCPLTMMGQAIEVSKYEPPPPVSLCTVEVTGPCSVVSEDHLEILDMYFESNKRSGGGDIVGIEFDTVNNMVLVTFDSEEVAQRVVEKGNHVIRNEKLNVKLLIPSKTTIKTKAMEEKRKPTKTIKVQGLNKYASRDTVEFYFENSRRSGGGEIETIKSDDEDEDVLLITFKSSKVVKRICANKGHEIDGKPLRVCPYYECQGGAIWSSRIHVLKILEPVDVQYDPNYLRILERSCCSQLHNDLKRNNCTLEFKDKVLQLHCTLTPEITGVKELAEKWEVSSRSIIDQFISVNIIERPLKSSEQVWNELFEFFNSENMQACEELVASIDRPALRIILVGFRGPVQDKLRQLKEKHTEIEKRLSRRTETIDNLDNLQLKLLVKIGVFEDLKHELEDIKIDIGDGKLTVEGQPEDITVVRVRWYDMDNRISRKQWNHGFSKECVFFVNNVLTNKIQSLLEGNNIIAVWEMDAKVFSICAYEVDEKEMDDEVFDEDVMNSQVCKKAEEILKSAVIEMKEPVEDSIIEVLTSPEWICFSEHITETFENSAELETKDSELLMHGMRKETHEVHTRVKDFLNRNVILSDTLKTGTVNIRFIREHRQDFVSRLEKRLDQHKVKIELKDESVNIRGNKRGIFEAKKEFKIFFDAIVLEKHTIQKVAVKNVFKDENKHGTIKKIEQETSGLIKIPGENATFVETADIADEEIKDSDGYMIPHFSRGATGSNQDVFRPKEQGFKAQNGVEVYLVKGELGKQDGNIIVVTTAPNLNLNSDNACKSVLREGGQDLHNEFKEKYPNEIKFGEIAVVHGHGALECNFVYLTTLPNWNSEHNPEQIVEKIMKDSLELAEKHKKYSIVFCAMGTGQQQYPPDLVAMIMYQAVIDFDKNHPQSSLKEVKFVLYPKDFATIKAFEEEENFRQVGGGERLTFELKTGKITIELLVENIAQQRVDAILCSTSPSMELKRSGACQALVRVGGKTLQDECKSKYGNKLEEGNVAEIGGGNLSCKSVFLTVLPRFNADAINILTFVIQSMLAIASSKGYKSLALPALGTGFLHYPTNEVCQCMFQTMIDWAKKNPASSITNIRLIMNAKDHDVIQKFKSYILNEKGKGKREHRRSSGYLKQQGARKKKVFPILIPKKDEKALYNAHADEDRCNCF